MVYTFGPQMRAFVFFVCLCFLLLRGDDSIYSCIDVEDEDDVLARKYRLLTQCNLTHTIRYIPGEPWGYSNDKLPFCYHLSYKYLIQRALRI